MKGFHKNSRRIENEVFILYIPDHELIEISKKDFSDIKIKKKTGSTNPNIPRINVQVFFYFFESTKKILNKYSSYKNPISTNETNPNITKFISTTKKSISNLNKSQTFYNLSYLSQAYSKLRSVFQYQYKGTSFFLKNGIKDYFVGTQEIFNSELRHRNPSNYGINQ
ncbi:hypothetical protein G4B88_004368 [Cannabis sativa]|uniref:Uncharacterized protein n=1 Tax=Cannabis sativa TaxID=3483 RepID=A0A7J6I0S6_CANSA|nr:hypothetical protein G4B88_004368 [Cannabis sativa]